MRFDWQPECPSLCPLPTQELLLLATFAAGARARDAFTTWKQATGFKEYSDIDFCSSRLLPATYHNFRRQGIADPWLPRMGALHRYHWTRNVLTQNRFVETAQALQHAGCESVVLGGFALAAGGYFDDPGERPLLEGELLISLSDAPGARRALAELGWRDAAAVPAPVAGWRSEWWRSADDQSLRIHYRWLPKTFPVVTRDRISRYSQSAELGGVPLRIPDPADLLVYACVANRRPARDLSHRFLWAASVMRILERGGARIDWDRLRHESRHLCTLFPLRESLGYLTENFHAAVPASWLAAARKAKIRRSEKRPFYRATRQWLRLARATDIGAIKWPWDDYVASERGAGRKPSLTALTQYWDWRLRCELARVRSARSVDETRRSNDTGTVPRAA
jgi:Uncharacterised nucleotidyltransferase